MLKSKWSTYLSILSGILLTLNIAACSVKDESSSITTSSNKKASVTTLEILYMNHGPVQPILSDLELLLKPYKKDVLIGMYDYEKDLDFKNKKGINSHVPIVIWVNNQNIININGKEVKFIGFPKDKGPGFAQGKWTYDELRFALDKAIEESKK
ncbi:MAG: hypothetical protein HQK49_21690 [Oligoflexia bacterium]|nr:hypothetical protein [Oligoflexia bacterium]